MAAQVGLLRHNLFARRQFKPAVLKARLPADLRLHELRHTYAVSCIASPGDLLRSDAAHGHSSITVTYNTYVHLFPERDQEITRSLEQFDRPADGL